LNLLSRQLSAKDKRCIVVYAGAFQVVVLRTYTWRINIKQNSTSLTQLKGGRRHHMVMAGLSWPIIWQNKPFGLKTGLNRVILVRLTGDF